MVRSVAFGLAALQWGRGCVATEIVCKNISCDMHAIASMGPWLCSHGNIDLQLLTGMRPGASMGPWLCSHGNPCNGLDFRHKPIASMGPWLCSHGN